MKRFSILLVLILAVSGCSSKEERRDSLIAKAEKLVEQGQCPEAKIEAKNALKLDPNAAGAYLVLGQCDMKNNEWRGAFASFTRAYDLQPESLVAMEGLSRLYIMANDVENARKLADKLLDADPNSANYKIIRAGVAMREKNLVQAEKLLLEAIKADPNNEEATIGLAATYAENGQLDKAEALVRDALKQRADSPVFLNYLVNLALRNKKYDDAASYLHEMHKLQPDNDIIALRLADVYMITKRPDEAIAMLKDALQKAPDKDDLRARLAEVLYGSGKIEEGLEVLNQAPKSSPRLGLAKSAGLMQLNRADEAITLLQGISTAQDAGPMALAAKQRLAEIYVLQNKMDLAMAELNAIIERNPNDNKALALRGRLNYLLGNYAASVTDLRIVLRDNPNDSASAMAMAESQRALGNNKLAEETLKSAIAANPAYMPNYLVLATMQRIEGNPNAALATLKSGAEKTDTPELHFAYVDQLVAAKRLQEASSYLNTLAARDNFFTQATMRKAALAAEQKKYTDARNFYTAVLAKTPEYTQAAEGYVLMEVAAGRRAEALTWAAKRVEERPEDPSAMALLGQANLASNKNDQAIENFKAASQLAPRWEQPYVRLIQLYRAKNQPAEAVSYLRAAWEKDPENFTPAVILASYHESQKEFAEAEQIYRQILSRTPNLMAVENNLAYIITQYNTTPARLDEALKLAIHAASTDSPPALDTLGWVYYKLGRMPEALESITKAYQGAGNSPAIAYHLAVVHNAMGNKAEAKNVLTELLNSKKEFDEKQEAQNLLEQL